MSLSRQKSKKEPKRSPRWAGGGSSRTRIPFSSSSSAKIPRAPHSPPPRASRTPPHGHARAKHRPELAQVPEHASSGDPRPRPRAPDDQRRARHLIGIPRRDLQDVIRALEPRERVGRVELGELHAPRALLRVHLAHESRTFPSAAAAAACSAMTPSNSGSLRSYSATSQPPTPRAPGTGRPRRPTPGPRRSPRRDHHLPRHVQAVEVVSGVGLRVPAFFAARTTSLNGCPAPTSTC